MEKASRGNLLAAGLSELSARWARGAARALLRACAESALGLLAARGLVFGECAPFGIAAVAAAPPTDGVFVLAGALAGYLLPGGPPYPLRYVAAAAAVYLLKWVLSGFESLAGHPLFAPVLAGGMAFLTGCAVLLAGASSPYEALLLLAETLLCGCAAAFFERGVRALQSPGSLLGQSQRGLTCAAFSLCVLLLGLQRLQFAGISLGRILAVVAVLCAGRYAREAGGAVAGAAAGLTLGLAGGGAAALSGAYAFGGLTAGIFGRLGRFWCSAAFLLGGGAALLSAGASASQGFTGLYEGLAGALLFCVLPEKWLCRLGCSFAPARGVNPRRLRESLAARLEAAAAALDDIAGTVDEVSGKLSHAGSEDLSAVYEDACEATCAKCGMRMYCWVKEYSSTMDALMGASGTLRQNGALARGDLPAHFAARCTRLPDFLASVERGYARYTARRAAELKNEQLRRLLIPQLGGTSGFLRRMAEELGREGSAPGGERVKAALASCGAAAVSSELRLDAHGRVTVEAELDSPPRRMSGRALANALSAAFGRELSPPEAVPEGEDGGARLLFRERPRYSVAFGEASIQKTGESLCGDACASFVDEKGRALLILSDGMGCGGSAAVDANLTVELIARLLRGGFGFDEAAQAAAAAMLVKSGEETFSTLDIACIDLFDGTATFLKAGAPPAYVRRGGRVERIEPCSMPLGILPGARLEKATVRLARGDAVLVVSDGAASGDDSFLAEELRTFSGDPRPFARRLAQLAREKRADGHDDDVTVLAAVLS